jgi:hypothetical protein
MLGMGAIVAPAVECEFWQPYRGADEATYLLATFDDDALPVGTADVGKAQHIGTVAHADGRFGRALKLDGRGGLRYDAAGIFPGPHIAIEAWVRLSSYPSKRAAIVSRPAQVDGHASYDPAVDVTKGFQLFIDHEGALHLETTNCFYGRATLTSTAPAAVPLGRWVHVAGVCVGHPVAYRRLFVDGHEVQAEAVTWGKGLTVSNDEESRPGPIYVGNDASGAAGLDGLLDQVRIHRRIAKFWPREDDLWTRGNRPGETPVGPPHFLAQREAVLYLPLDGDLSTTSPIDGLQVKAGDEFAAGVCGKALRGRLELSAAELLDLDEGSVEFWLHPGGVNSYSDWNHAFASGPFTFYIFNRPGLSFKPLALYFRKPDGELQFVEAGDTEVHPGRWYHLAITWKDDEVAVFVDGQPGERSFGAPLPSEANGRRGRRLVLSAPDSLVDEVRLYRAALAPEEVANAYYRYRDHAKLVEVAPQAVRLRAQYFPSQNRIFYRLLPDRDDIERAVLTLLDADDRVILTKSTGIADDEQSLDLPDLPDGAYTLRAAGVVAGQPNARGASVQFRRQRFAWEGLSAGAGDEVYPPFQPIAVEGQSLAVVGRRYQFNGFGLLDRVTSAGDELLAAPIALHYEAADGQGPWSAQAGRFTSALPHVAVFEAEAAAPAIRIRTRSTTEVDGCVKVEMSLLPGARPARIERLWIEIPLHDARSPLMHTVTAGLRQNHAGGVPSGEGRIWDGSKAHRYQKWLNAFVPYIWLGSPRSGLAWFAENDRGWITQKNLDAPIQEIVRQQGRLTLRVYLINEPTTISRQHDLVFGMQASPTKPMPDGWRTRLDDAPGGLAVVPWGGLDCASQAPFRDDWQIVDKILEPRNGKPYDAEWFRNYSEAHRPPPAHGNWPWLDACGHFASRARDVGPRRPLAVYHEEMRGCPARPEWAVYQDEWTAHGHRYQRTQLPEHVFGQGYEALSAPEFVTFPPSYQDFGCSIAEQWLRRGVSLYWDNMYPYVAWNPRATAAYTTDDGRLQPCMIIWNQRDYTKRVWHLVQQWRAKRAEPLEFTLHMTNTLLLPVHTWGTVNLDHELDTDTPFSPEWLQTETVGLQVGNMPLTLYNITGKQKSLEGMSAEAKALTEWAMRAVHEVGHRQGAHEKILRQFGYGLPNVAVHNYWAERPALTITPAEVKWLALADATKKQALVVLASWSAEPVQVVATLDAARLGFAPNGALTDVMTDEPAGQLRDGRIEISLPKFGVKVLRIETRAASRTLDD